jgi:lactoylglutathione lyase
MQKILFILICTWFAKSVAAQDSSFQFSFNHMAFSVKDPDRSLKFYRDVLGLKEIENRTHKEGIRWISLGEGKELHLVSTITEPVMVNKAVHLALTTTRFDAFVKKLESLKISYSDWPGTEGKVYIRADGIKQIYFRDPDGYWIEINSVSSQ